MAASNIPVRTPGRLGDRKLAAGLIALAVVGVAGVVVTACLQREAIAVRLAIDYFRRQGVPSEIRIDRLDLSGVAGSVRLGPAAHPDLTIRRLEAGFGGPPSIWGGLKAPPIRTLTLVGPTLHARLRDGRLDVGSLQPLLDQALEGGRGRVPSMVVTIRQGLLDLATPAGRLFVAFDATLRDGRVTSLHARLEPVDLTVSGFRIAQVQGVLSGAATGRNAIHLAGAFAADQAHGQGAGGSGLVAQVEGFAPNGSGSLTGDAARPLDATVRLRARRFALRPARGPSLELQDAGATADLSGALAPGGGFAGSLALDGDAGRLGRGGLDLAEVRWRARASGLHIARNGSRFEAAAPFALELTAAGGRARQGALGWALMPLQLRSSGRFDLGPGVSIDAAGDLRAGAGLAHGEAVRIGRSVLGAIDPMAAGAFARALERMQLDVPSYVLALRSQSGVALRLPRGAAIGFDRGRLDILPPTASSKGPPWLRDDDHGGLSGTMAARLRADGLPTLSLQVPDYASAADSLRAHFALAAQGDLGPVREGRLRAEGQVSGRRSGATWSWAVAASSCWPLTTVAMRLGKVTADNLALQACPIGDAPLLSLGPGVVRARARIIQATAALPASDTDVRLASAEVDVERKGADLGGYADLHGLVVEDTAPNPRWRPIRASGGLKLADNVMVGSLSVATVRAGVALGELRIRVGLADGSGQATFSGAPLQFASGGLQPGDIVPAAGALLPQAVGDLQVAVAVSWTTAGIAGSSGEVRSDGLSFRSPAGRLDGVRGDVRLTSLAPLTTAPDQVVTADRLETLLPLDAVKTVVTLGPDRLQLEDAAATVADGRVSLDAMSIPLAYGTGARPSPLSGVLRVKGIDAQRLLDVLNLSTAVSLQARLDGSLPFVLTSAPAGETLRVSGGRIAAEGPGRLTIHRQALSGVLTAGGAAGAVASNRPNAVQDFAYQALEDLAFTRLDAEVDSRAGGRLGAVFHIAGRHDPPHDAPTRVGLWALLRGRAFDRPLPLPKGTPVDVTLDTSLNLDDILGEFGRPGDASSASVQP